MQHAIKSSELQECKDVQCLQHKEVQLIAINKCHCNSIPVMHCVTLLACLVRKQLITFFVRTDSVGCAMYGAVLIGECTRGCGRLQCSEMQQLAEILHCSAASAQLHRVYYSALGGCGILLCPWGCHGSHPTSATFAQTIIIFVFIIISIVFIVFLLNISIITVIIVISIIRTSGT